MNLSLHIADCFSIRLLPDHYSVYIIMYFTNLFSKKIRTGVEISALSDLQVFRGNKIKVKGKLSLPALRPRLKKLYSSLGRLGSKEIRL